MIFSEKQIDLLRMRVSSSMSDFRFVHTAEVEKMAVRLGELYAPEKIDVLRVAALLHDVTKEKKPDEHIKMLEENGESVSDDDRAAYKTLHARSAVYAIKKDYPEFATDEVIDAVRYHTTGRADMNICESIIFLADYIDESRKFDDCIYLRKYFWDAEPEKMNKDECVQHLYKTLLLAFDLTLKALEQEKSPISVLSIEARNSLILKLNK